MAYSSYKKKKIDPAIVRVQKSLPVFAWKDVIVRTVKEHKITLIVGETGSGKTTQIPQYLLEWDQVTPSKKIVCTQPRTVAAQSVAMRVAQEQGENIGETVGYHIRLNRRAGPNTKLEFMTEGVLFRKAMSCDNLGDYKIVIIDEAHERTVNADLLMGFLKSIVQKRPDLRVIIMSATLDEARFKAYFRDPKGSSDLEENPPVIRVPGSANPVQHHYLHEPTKDYIADTIDLIQNLHRNGCTRDDRGQWVPDGHILVFMTGAAEIDSVCTEIGKLNPSNKHAHSLEILPLYGAMRPEERDKVFAESSSRTRKCVVSTNIAETSLTIDNVVYVIDTGLSRQKMYDWDKGVEMLAVRAISKSSVKQRVGRAGRVKPGVAYHLYTQEGYTNLANETDAEIVRSGFVNELLAMLALHIGDPLRFDFIDPPHEMTMARALWTLKCLGAIDSGARSVQITKIGEQMARFPVNPHLAKSLIAAKDYDCVQEMVIIAAMMEIEDRLWMKPRSHEQYRNSEYKAKKALFYHCSGDHLTLLNVFNAFQAVQHNQHGWCKEHFLNFRLLERATDIKRQIETSYANLMRDEQAKQQQDSQQQNTAVVFKTTPIFAPNFYENILKALLSGHFMNLAVKGFGENFWRVFVPDMDGVDHMIDAVDKPKCGRHSMFYKNGSNRTNWVIFHEVSVSHTTELRILTAIKTKWLFEIDTKGYFNAEALRQDGTPIAAALRNAAYPQQQQQPQPQSQPQPQNMMQSAYSAQYSSNHNYLQNQAQYGYHNNNNNNNNNMPI